MGWSFAGDYSGCWELNDGPLSDINDVTQMFAGLSEPSYGLGPKLNSFIALAPVAYIGHPQGVTYSRPLLPPSPLCPGRAQCSQARRPETCAPCAGQQSFPPCQRLALQVVPSPLRPHAQVALPSMMTKTTRHQLTRTLCSVCASTIFALVGGGDSQQLNKTRLPIYTGHTPQTTSHYSPLLCWRTDLLSACTGVSRT